MVNTLGILDVETTSLDPATGHVIEVAFGVYSLEYAELVDVTSTLVRAPADEAQKTFDVHRIPPALVEARGVDFDEASVTIEEASMNVDLLATYNAKFDSAWFPSLKDRQWLCLCNDMEYPRKASNKSLLSVAHAHGVQIGTAHRAADDVLLCARLLTRCAELGMDLEDEVRRALRPKRRYRANVSYDANQLAKDAGFRWDASARIWWRDLVPEDVPSLNFPFQISETR